MDYIQEQKHIEEEATLTGVRRAGRVMSKAQERGQEASTPVGSAMMKRIIGPMQTMLLNDLKKRSEGRATKGGSLLKPLRDLDPHLLCVAATRAALNQMSRPMTLTTLARRIGESLEDELRWYKWERLNKAQAEAVRLRVNKGSTSRQRRSALAGFARRWEARVLDEAWSTYKLVGVGMRFIDYLVRLGVFEMTKIPKRVPGKKLQAAHAVRLTAGAAQWASEMAEFVAVSRPLSWPLVIPPVPWTAPLGGGFHFRDGADHPAIPRALQPLPLVRRASKKQKAMLLKADLTHVYAALNAAQATAWRIHPRVYSTLCQMMDDGSGGPGLTMGNPKPIPERPTEADADSAVNTVWRNEARKAHTSNVKASSKRLAEHRVFSTARKFNAYPSIYFAYNLDFRGRMYACSDDLSPQGGDMQRGLLEFAHGDPLTEDGVEWLMVHLANCYGVDKVSFEERRQWTADHVLMILECASRPLDCAAWHKAEKPWQFLAACFAWQDYHLGGIGTMCRVPVMLDGSCSGIQHYAALLRDEVAGEAVNLIPRDQPGDLYADVARRGMELLAESTAPFAKEWLAWGIDRKIVKRSVMVLPYGGTFLSNLDYVREAVRDRIGREGQPQWLTEENYNDAFVALAKIIWAAMHEVVEAPIDGMKFVKRIAKAWRRADSGTEVSWVCPSGFPVAAPYRELTGKAGVSGIIDGKPFTVAYLKEGKRPNWSRVEAAAPPNFVHSLDASHLVLALARGAVEGVAQVAVVHDAFGTTPSKTGEFVRILREEFSRMYQEDQFDCLRTALRKIGGEVPEAPQSGRLNVADIAHATYLFA